VREAVSADTALRRVLRRAFCDLERPLEPLAATEIVLGAAEALRARDRSLAAARPMANADRAVERARAFLEANLERQVDAAELEAASGLGRYALARQFRARLGTSPYRYLTLRRLDRARGLIVAGNSLADAAFACGFADQSHMTRQFKDCYGISPGRWRKLRRGA
jgi:AraC-like DNA-binding protein